MENVHFEWKKEYSVHVSMLDGQHQQLIKIIDDLYQAILKNQGKEALNKVFTGLGEFADLHFATEEKYFNEFGYPEAETHVALHKKFRKDFLAMEAKSAGEASPYDVLFFLENWWINHIMDIDKRYSDFFNEHGLH